MRLLTILIVFVLAAFGQRHKLEETGMIPTDPP